MPDTARGRLVLTVWRRRLGVAAIMLLNACDSTFDAGRSAVRIQTTTQGTNVDPDGYSVTIDGGAGAAIPASGELVIDGLVPELHNVQLGGLAPNCAVAGENPHPVTTTADDTVIVAFAVTCAAPVPLIDQIVFTSNRDGNSEIYLMQADGSGQVNLTRSPESERLPAISPDGMTIAFISDRRVRGVDDLYAMNSDGTGVRPLHTTTGRGDGAPVWSPDGSRVAFREQLGRSTIVLHVVDVDGTGLRDFQLDGSVLAGPAWSPDGQRLAFTSNSSSCPDCASADVFVIGLGGTGLENLTNDPANLSGLDWSPDGTRLAFASRSLTAADFSLLTVDPDTKVLAPLNVQAPLIENLGWSPDGSSLVFDDGADVFTVDVDGIGLLNLTVHPAADFAPVWSPDGSRIAFTSDRTGDSDVFAMNVDGSGLTDLTNNPATDESPVWAPAP